MKTKYILTLIITIVISMTTFAQDEYIEDKGAAYRTYKLESADIKEFKTIDWDDVRETFKDCKPNSPIALKFRYKKPLQTGKAATEAFNFKFDGKASEIEELIAKSKKTLGTIVKVEGQKF